VKKYVIWLFGVGLFLSSCSRWQPLQQVRSKSFLIQAHAHNDYQHDRPLLDALDHRFGSIEADIHLVNDKLYVAHDAKDIQPERTLQSLYLDPLAARIRERRGFVYEKKKTIFLFIDIKTDADSTYAVLRQVLHDYRDMLTSYQDGRRHKKAVTVILSGNRPRQTMRYEPKRFAACDGRPEDLAGQDNNTLLPIISDKWSNHFSWYGEGPMPLNEKTKLDSMVHIAHEQGRWLRFWATDVQPLAIQQKLWAELIQAGVDLINTDKLAAFQAWLEHSSRVK